MSLIILKNKILFVIIFTLIVGCTSQKNLSLKKEVNWSKNNMFSYYDVKYIQLNFNPFVDNRIMSKPIEDFLNKDSAYVLDSDDKKRLFDIVSDSTNFGGGECGTFALNAGFVFLKNDSIKAKIEMGCGYSQWNFNPWNQMSRGISISEKGFEKMTIMLDEINRKMKK